MLNIRQYQTQILRPTLAFVGEGLPGFASQAAEELLLGTAAHESGFHYLAQIRGPAQGLYQIEPATCVDIFKNYLPHSARHALLDRVNSLLAAKPTINEQLASNLAFATAMARLVYWRSPVALAAAGDIAGHARVWKRVFNTVHGKGREADFCDAYRRLVTPNL